MKCHHCGELIDPELSAQKELKERMNKLEAALQFFLYADTQYGPIDDPYYRQAINIARATLLAA